MLTAQQRLGVVQGSLGGFSAGVSVDRGRDGVGKGKEEMAWKGRAWRGISTGRKASLD